MTDLTRKEVEILAMFEHAFEIIKGQELLIKKGLPKKEIEQLIEILKKDGYLEEADTPLGKTLCTIYSKISIGELNQLKKNFVIRK